MMNGVGMLECCVTRFGISENSLRSRLRVRAKKEMLGLKKKVRCVVSPRVHNMVLLNAIAVVYASSIPVVKEVEGLVDPAAFAVVRFGVSALAFFPFVVAHPHSFKPGLELGLWASGGYVLQAVGLVTSGAGRASFLSMLTVIVVPILQGLSGGYVQPRTWLGALTCLFGVALLESAGSPPCVGDLLNVMSAVCFGVHMVRTQHIARTLNNFPAILGYQLCVIALTSALWYLLAHNMSLSSLDVLSGFPWMAAVYTGVFSTGLCLWGEMVAMQRVSATEAAIVFATEPVWGSVFAWLLLGETWDTPACIGAALILAGSLTVQIFGSSSDQQPHQSDHIALSASPLVPTSTDDDTSDTT